MIKYACGYLYYSQYRQSIYLIQEIYTHPAPMAEEAEERIEAAEEAGDLPGVLALASECSGHGGDEDWACAAEAALDALYRLTKGGSAGRAGTGAGSGGDGGGGDGGGGDGGTTGTADPKVPLRTALACLEAWGEEEAIVEVALGCVAVLVPTYPEDEEDEDFATSAASLVVGAMRNFPDEGTLQEQACLAAEAMAMATAGRSDRRMGRALVRAGIGTELEAAATGGRITNERNRTYPGRAAAALGIRLGSSPPPSD